MRTNMRIVLLSGVSGSGKSTFINKHYPNNAVVCSADNYFTSGGEYHFDYTKLGEAHGQCLANFAEAVVSNMFSTIVVDNTNLTALDLAPYVALANAFGVRPELITLHVGAVVAATRNQHDVPSSTINRQIKTLEDRRLPAKWNISIIDIFDPSFLPGKP